MTHWPKKTVTFDPPIPWFSPDQIDAAMDEGWRRTSVRELRIEMAQPWVRIATIIMEDRTQYEIAMLLPSRAHNYWGVGQIIITRPPPRGRAGAWEYGP